MKLMILFRIQSRIFILVGFFGLFLTLSVTGQDMAQLAMRARINLYDKWQFDSAAFYFDQVIGKKYAPAFAYSDYGRYLLLKKKPDEGLANIKRAAEMSPSDQQLTTWYAWALLWKGDLSDAKKWITKALENNPYDGETLYVASMIASAFKNHEEALVLANKAGSKDPNFRAAVSLALAKASHNEEAIAWTEKIKHNVNAFDAMLLAEVFAHLRNDDKAVEYLQKAYELKHPFMPWLKFIPGTLHLHDDPRFNELVGKMNLPE